MLEVIKEPTFPAMITEMKVGANSFTLTGTQSSTGGAFTALVVTQVSDIRMKKNITAIVNASETLKKLSGVSHI